MSSLDEEIATARGYNSDVCVCSAPVVNLAQKLLAEGIGTFFVVFGGCGSVVVNKMYGSVTFPGICIAWGLIVMVMIYSVGHVSGAHFNPAVTITFAILKQFPWKQLPLYVITQVIGAILASAALYLLFNPKPEHFYGTTPVGSAVQSFVLEIIISFLLMFVVSGVSTDSRAIGELGGVAVGSTILLNVLVAGPVSGASMNPARSIGPAIVMHNFKAIWAYILGPLLGTLAGGFAYKLLQYSDKPLREMTKTSSFTRER
ncbi:putative aquaporin NIP-type [Curcuma longa]|uniref:putative aquaporin NIP-type n=1 Tax=Curcuma longa TaxID=136217 RepID=UPI003D9E6F57